MTFFEELESLGVDVNEGLDRVMGDKDLYQMMFGMFVDSVQASPIQAGDFDGASLDALIAKVHTLKGITGNLSIAPLFERYEKSLGLLRAGQPAEAKKIYLELVPIQEAILQCVQHSQN